MFLLIFASCSGLNKDVVQKQPNQAPATEKSAEKSIDKSTEKSPEESLKASFPNLEFEKMSKTPIEGIYEVISSGRILYYAPKAECIIAGEIFSKSGVNLTQAKELELLSQRAKQAPLDKAIKIGGGKNTIVEFTDIDCQYCRTASQFLEKMENVTRYIYFVSLSGNPQTQAKTKYVLCATDKAKAYEEAMTGKLDDMKFKACDSKEAESLFQSQKEIGQKVNPPGTPFFLVNGKPVMGANMPEINKLLGEGPK
jgi:thiol:disulfide interchange protein DsbC